MQTKRESRPARKHGNINLRRIELGKLISSILIANRGEIAVRVIRACKEMKSNQSLLFRRRLESKHVKSAERHTISVSAPNKSYLNIDRIIEIAISAGAEAIHPDMDSFLKMKLLQQK